MLPELEEELSDNLVIDEDVKSLEESENSSPDSVSLSMSTSPNNTSVTTVGIGNGEDPLQNSVDVDSPPSSPASDKMTIDEEGKNSQSFHFLVLIQFDKLFIHI